MENKILFQTISGSRLYGLHHAESDYDWYTVVDKVKTNKAKYSTHTIVGNRDSVVVDFGTWINLAQKGVPQALEAMFSQQAYVDELAEFRAAFRAGRQAEATYLRTMKAMSVGEDTYKQRRHVMRLGFNLHDLKAYGRFNPTLHPDDVFTINQRAGSNDMTDCYNFVLDLAQTVDVC